MQRSLQGARERGAARYPHNIRRWVNLTARGDTTALHPRLKPLYHEMLDLGLVESIEDFVDFDNFFRGSLRLNAHESYGYLAQPHRWPKSSATGSNADSERARWRLDRRAGWLLRGGFELRLDDDVDAAVALAALLGVVVRDRLRLAVADRADAKRRHAELARQDTR